MEPGEKIKLVESLVNVLDNCGIFASLEVRSTFY